MDTKQVIDACRTMDHGFYTTEFWEMVSTFAHTPTLELTCDGFCLVFDEAREWTFELKTGNSRHTRRTFFRSRQSPQYKGFFYDTNGMVYDQETARVLWNTVVGQLVA